MARLPTPTPGLPSLSGRGYNRGSFPPDPNRQPHVMRLTYSIADQNFATATSIGIYNISIGFIRAMLGYPDLERVALLSNPTIRALDDLDERVERREFAYPVASTRGRLWWDTFGCYREADRLGNPWLFLPKGFGSMVLRPPVRLAACLADTTSVIYRERYPGTVSRSKHAYYVRTHRQTIRHARLIFTISEFSRQQIMEWADRQGIPCPPVIAAGCAPDHPHPPHRAKKDQVLVDLRRAPHKRSDLAVAWVERWREATAYNGRIIAVGTLPDGVHIPGHPAWSYLGRVDPGQRETLLAESRVLVHFTEHEGFGLPPVESILAGTPSVYSLIPCTEEVMDGVGCPFTNHDFDGFAAAMDRAFAVTPEDLNRWADDLRAKHNWPVIGRRILDALRDLS